jgi:predicted kinase
MRPLSVGKAMRPTTIVLITGYPASGKTTLARYLAQELKLPPICKDDLKEVLYETLGWQPVDWSRKLGMVAWSLLYQQVEILLQAHIDLIAEGNFDPKYANPEWQKLTTRFDLKIVQVRCDCDADLLIERDRQRIEQGTRHPGHIRDEDPAFYEMVKRGPIGWIDVESEKIVVNTDQLAIEEYAEVARKIREIGYFASS